MSGLKPLTVNTPTEQETEYYAEDDAAIFQSIFGEDGVSTTGQACKATVLSNNKVRIADGVICVGGHFARIPYGDYIDCEIDSGQSEKKRNDIIVARFESTGTGGIDTYTCEVKKGTAGSTATDPEIVQEDLYKAGKVRELPLYRVKIEGLSITAVEQLFTLRKTNEELEKELASLNSKWTDELTGNNQYCKYRYVKFGKTAVIIGNLAANNNNNNIRITFPFAFKFTPSASVTLESNASSNVNPLITEISTTSFRADSTPGSTSKTAARFIIIGEVE